MNTKLIKESLIVIGVLVMVGFAVFLADNVIKEKKKNRKLCSNKCDTKYFLVSKTTCYCIKQVIESKDLRNEI